MFAAIVADPGAAVQAVVNGIVEPIRSDWDARHPFRAAGRATFEVVALAAGGVGKIGKAEELANVSRTADFVASPSGIVVDARIAEQWSAGTFDDVVESIAYHYAKHGEGRDLAEYTEDAIRFYETNRSQATWGKWRTYWEPSFKLEVGQEADFYTADGRILSYRSMP